MPEGAGDDMAQAARAQEMRAQELRAQETRPQDAMRGLLNDPEQAALRHAAFLMEREEHDGAIETLRTLIAFRPNSVAARREIAEIHLRRGDLSAAESALRAALALDPKDVPAAAALARVLFYAGRWNEAWRAYRIRFKLMAEPPACYRRRPDGSRAPLPPWDGSGAPERLLVMAEQGLGDTLQFARFLPALAERGVAATLVAPQRLGALLSTIRTPTQIVPSEKPATNLPAMPWTPLLDLPLALGLDPADYGAPSPYLFADEERRKIWRRKLGARGFKVGLVWSGNPAHSGDRRRSMRLADLAPLAAIPELRFVSLQQGETAAAEVAASPFADRFIDLGGPIDVDHAFVDTAAIVASLDLVVSVDTAPAHLAGALGRPLAILLAKHGADWRWLGTGSTTLWYPTATLYRQTRHGDWSGAVAALADAIRARLDKAPGRAPVRRMAAPIVPVSVGELIDKLTILQIKVERLSDDAARAHALRERDALEAVAAPILAETPALRLLAAELKAINETLWDIENRMRFYEKARVFHADFIAGARSVYVNNDRRAAIKRDINDISGSPLVEMKEHRTA